MSRETDPDEPTAESLDEMPELDFAKLTPLGRGRHAHLATGRMVHHVTIDPELWPYFGSAEKVNEGLRALVAAAKVVQRDPERGEPAAAK